MMTLPTAARNHNFQYQQFRVKFYDLREASVWNRPFVLRTKICNLRNITNVMSHPEYIPAPSWSTSLLRSMGNEA